MSMEIPHGSHAHTLPRARSAIARKRKNVKDGKVNPRNPIKEPNGMSAMMYAKRRPELRSRKSEEAAKYAMTGSNAPQKSWKRIFATEE
jgi:hypothetical protein